MGMRGFKFHRKLLRLLSVISTFRTDPRDKIFAFLNLAEDKCAIVPDYTLDVKEVFRNAAEGMMRTSLSALLAVLSHIQNPSETRISGLPSWVPDFSAKLGRTPFDEGGYEDGFRVGYNSDDDEDDDDDDDYSADPPFRHLDPDGTHCR